VRHFSVLALSSLHFVMNSHTLRFVIVEVKAVNQHSFRVQQSHAIRYGLKPMRNLQGTVCPPCRARYYSYDKQGDLVVDYV